MRSGSQCSHLEPGGWAEGGRCGLGLLSRAQPGPGAARRYRSPVSPSSSPSAQCPAGAARPPSRPPSRPGPGPGCSWERRAPWRPRGTPCAASRRPPRPEAGRRALRRCRHGTARRGPALTQRTASAAPGHSITECPRTPLSGNFEPFILDGLRALLARLVILKTFSLSWQCQPPWGTW